MRGRKTYRLTFTDASGRMLRQQQLKTAETVIDLRPLPAGAYLLTLTGDDGGRESRPLLIQH